MGEWEELRNRVEAKKHRLLARINELKADGRSESTERLDNLQAKLDELAKNVKNGWDNISDAVAEKLNEWLKDDKV